MIEIKDKSQCCGCAACIQKCPKQCISLVEDKEGFLYPKVNKKDCINCGICDKVCPFKQEPKKLDPIRVLAAYNSDEQVRLKSSSGGIFTSLAEKTIHNGGVVFGARFNNQWDVVLDYTETLDGLELFRGSKYVQSSVGDTYEHCEQFLKQGREVLFTGTPCQIAGLKWYLAKDYVNLLTVDFICHGTPSPKVWRKYVTEFRQRNPFNNVYFRDKVKGWNHFSITFKIGVRTGYSEIFQKDPYLQLFLNNYILRPSCYDCKARCGHSGSDITLADFWHIENEIPEMFDDKGTSMVLLNTHKGEERFLECDGLKTQQITHEVVVRNNPAWMVSYQMPEGRCKAFKMLEKRTVKDTYIRILHPESLFYNKVKNKLRCELSRVKRLI